MIPFEQHGSAIAQFLEEHEYSRTKLRLAQETDSNFILDLRLDTSRNKNISETKGELSAQIAWMLAYLGRFSKGKEAYFIIEVEGKPQGTLRWYDYNEEFNSFSWGSWIIRPGAPVSTGYASAILAYDLAFGWLRFTQAHFEVRKGNTSVWKFHEKMGARLMNEDTLTRFYIYSGKDYQTARGRLSRFTQNKGFV